MESNSESTDDERIENLEKIKESKKECELHQIKITNSNSNSTNLKSETLLPEKVQQKFESDVTYEIDKSLSSQVMEYYNRYSQNSNLNRFFSLPGTNAERHNHSWKAYEPILPRSRQTITTSNDKSILNFVDAPKERRRWTRPPLIGQLSGSPGKVIPNSYTERIFLEPRASSPDINVKSDILVETDINVHNEFSQRIEKSGIYNSETVDRDLKILSPTSSNTSHKPLEWDSWADVGYNNVLSSTEKEPLDPIQTVEQKVSTHSLCPTSFRLDPEGTTTSNVESFNGNTINSPSRTFKQQSSKPDAHSTQLTDDMFISEDEFKITPIIKTTYSNIIVGNVTGNNDISLKSDAPTDSKEKSQEELSSKSVDKIDKSTVSDCKTSSSSKKYISISNNPKTPIRRSLSELDLRKINDDNKGFMVPFNFQSTSSFTTIVNKPILCDKFIQINSITENGSNQATKETQVCLSVGIDQAKKINVEEKVKNWQIEMHDKANETDKLQNEKEDKSYLKSEINNLPLKTSQTISKYDDRIKTGENSLTKREALNKNDNVASQHQEEMEGGGTSNSFEYFPGHTYQNFDHRDNTSHISSIQTDRSYSTMPNTSSSLDEKLWGHSDSLLHDLERSLTILKSLVNANKCDKQVKKRLIHHVIKRLVTAKYTDDKIECKLEDNVPWNPDNTRNKIYCTEIIQALAKKRNQHNSTEESSENSKLGKRIYSSNRKNQNNRDIKNKSKFINSESSDNFDERNTDRTDCMQDGRKARMGLRNDNKHCFNYYRHGQLKHPKDNQVFEIDKTESSDSFLPQLPNLNYQEKSNNKSTNGIIREKLSSSMIPTTTSASTKTHRIISTSTSTVTTSISTSSNITSGNTTVITTATNTTSTTTPISINSSHSNSEKQKQVQHNVGQKKTDWRLPSTMSEKRFAYEWCNSKIVSATRLIDYVEMEKKNQLMWINSEINHLSSLKKLLEESIQSIKKDKKNNSREKSLLDVNEKSKQRLEENLPKYNNFKNKQWSSHGNLIEKCNENQKILERKNSHLKHASNGTETKSSLSDSGQTVRSQLSEMSSLSSEVSRLEKNKNDRYKCQQQLGFSSESSPQLSNSQSKQLHTDDQKPISNQSQMNFKKETKNQLNDQCKSDFIVTEDEKKFNRAKYYHKCLCTSDVLVVCCNHKDESKGTKTMDEKNQKRDTNEVDNKKKVQKNQDKVAKDCQKNEVVNRIVICENCNTCLNNTNRNSSSDSMYIKPIAYELSFSKKNEKISKTKAQSPQTTLDTSVLHNSCSNDNCNCDSTQFHLKDYLKKNKPHFVDNMEMRKRYVSEISQLRQLKKQNKMQLLAMNQPSNSTVNQKTRSSTKSSRKISDHEIKMRLRLRCLRLSEIRNRRKQQEKEDRVRRNHLMAKIFCKKLQQKVLEGQVDLSQSVSVISSL